MFFNSVKEINRSRKQINRLWSKEISNIYSKVTIEEKKLAFSKLWKICHHVSFGKLQLTKISLNLNTSRCNLKIRGLEAKLCVAFVNYDDLKSRSSCILSNKNINFNKNGTELKMEIPNIVLERWTLCFSSYKNPKTKVKLWWFGARERKKKAFFLPFILSEGVFFNIYVLSECMLYWMPFQNIR